ncbi:MAG: hypothetical protein AB9903_25515 [Vulcanimicrobiota bacterium]
MKAPSHPDSSPDFLTASQQRCGGVSRQRRIDNSHERRGTPVTATDTSAMGTPVITELEKLAEELDGESSV